MYGFYRPDYGPDDAWWDNPRKYASKDRLCMQICKMHNPCVGCPYEPDYKAWNHGKIGPNFGDE